ncbi:MAG: UDP-N-acetylmuramate dehydrogenase [Deltaproteobacteria bacterium]|nr:UDP-N-acetylmuramate dehydrogenase [Deltaproteobacteria bacterium]
MDFGNIKKLIEVNTDADVLVNEPLKKHTSLGIGGPSSLFVTVKSAEDALFVFEAAKDNDVSFMVIGGGTNILASDDGFEGIILKPLIKGIEISADKKTIKSGAYEKAAQLVTFAIENSLEGLEFAAGLPGTVGGAVAGNAGCFGSSFGQKLISATIIDSEGVLKTVDNSWFDFKYRESAVKFKKTILIDFTFEVNQGSLSALKEVAKKHLELRKTKHPSKNTKTAGSYFKNLPPLNKGERRRAAGEFLEMAGAKDISVNDAMIFEKHANIFVNKNNATAKDVLTLERILKELVFKKFGLVLEPEVRFLGRRPDGL